jgi:hypothetical protein
LPLHITQDFEGIVEVNVFYTTIPYIKGVKLDLAVLYTTKHLRFHVLRRNFVE